MSSLLPSRRHLTKFLSRVKNTHKKIFNLEGYHQLMEHLTMGLDPFTEDYIYVPPIYLNSLLIGHVQNNLISIYFPYPNSNRYSNNINRLKVFISENSYRNDFHINSENLRNFNNYFMFIYNKSRQANLNIHISIILEKINELNFNNISFFVRVEEDVYFRIGTNEQTNIIKKTINYFVNIFSQEFDECLGKPNIKFFSTVTESYQSECNISCVYAIGKIMLDSNFYNQANTNNKDDIIKSQIENNFNDLVLINPEQNPDIPLYHLEFNEDLLRKIKDYIKSLQPPLIQQGGILNKKLKIKKLKKYK